MVQTQTRAPHPTKPAQPWDLTITAAVLCRLTKANFDALDAARIGRSGSTGPGARGHEPFGPFMAIVPSDLEAALRALQWDAPTVQVRGSELLVSPPGWALVDAKRELEAALKALADVDTAIAGYRARRP